MGVLTGCTPRDEVLQGDLQDAIFAADFGELIAGTAHEVYRHPETFFRNTHPAAQLQTIVKAVFGRLANPAESGALLRLSTGFGGGKTHTLMTLWHLANHIGNLSLGTELLSAAGRPAEVTVVAIDASKAGGSTTFAVHDDATTHSFAGEIFYQLGGPRGLAALGAADRPEDSPADRQIDQVLPDGPLLFLIDELVIYQAKLSKQGRGNLLGFVGLLLKKVANRPRTALVITDPGSQQVYAAESEELRQAITEAAADQEDLLGRTTSNFDPIGAEGPQVIARRLFTSIDSGEAQRTANTYHSLYTRVVEEHPNSLPPETAHSEYTERIVRCYPFHPRLFVTAQDRLGALQDFQKSRGVLRLFARIIRDVWEAQQDVELITAGEVNWSSARMQGELLHRIKRDNFAAAVSADIRGHAAELDAGPLGIHRRVASALLLESLPLTAHSGLDVAELTLATLRPDEAGPEPSEALGRLTGACWHTYPIGDGRSWQFRYEPNVNKQIEERMEQVPREDAQSAVLAEVQGYFAGSAFRLVNWPEGPRQVADSAQFQVALCETEETARRVCAYVDDAESPRRFKNAILGVTASPAGLSQAITHAQRLLSAEAIQKETQLGDAYKLTRDQLGRLLPDFRHHFRLQCRRAFDRVITATAAYSMEERYQVADELSAAKARDGQQRLRSFLDDKALVYQDGDALDVQLFLDTIMQGATPLAEQPDVTTAKAVHERFLSAPGLRLVLGHGVVRQSLLAAVRAGGVVVRLADGRAFDAEGCVEGTHGQRRRARGEPLPPIPLDATVQVARAEHASARLWLHVDPAPGPDPDPPPPPPPPPLVIDGPVTTNRLDEAADYAQKRPLLHLRLTAKTPGTAENLLNLAQPLGADRLTIGVTLDGEFKDGGTVGFAVDGVSVSHPAQPLQMVRTLHRAMVEGASFEASVELHFGETGRRGMADALRRLEEDTSETITVEATCGPEGGA